MHGFTASVSPHIARIKRFARWVRRITLALFDPLVVVTMMTTAALIFGVLAYAQSRVPPQGGFPPWVWKSCVGIGAIGLIAIILQVHAILKRRRIREGLDTFIEQGHLFLEIIRVQSPTTDLKAIDEAIVAWIIRVNKFLNRAYSKGYVYRFRSVSGLGGLTFDMPSPQHEHLYRTVYARIANLEQFISEMNRS